MSERKSDSYVFLDLMRTGELVLPLPGVDSDRLQNPRFVQGLILPTRFGFGQRLKELAGAPFTGLPVIWPER